MPSTVFIQFDSPGAVRATPRRLHAAVGHIFDLPPGISLERARRIPALAARPAHDVGGPKPYSLGEMTQAPGRFGVELRLLDDRLLDPLDAWLAWGGVLYVGNGGESTAALAALEAQVLERVSWEDVAADATATAWNVHILTPVVFTSQGRHIPEVTAASLATSLQNRWWAWDRATAPGRVDRSAVTEAFDVDDRTHIVPVSLGMPSGGGRGRLSARRIEASEGSLRIRARDDAEESQVQLFSRLMALARFTNVGSHTGFGMGVLRVEPTA